MVTPFRIIPFLFLLIFFYSCDTSNYVDYTIINATSAPVKIIYNKWVTTDSVTNDTTIILLQNQQQTIATRVLFSSEAFNPDGPDTVWIFPKLLIYQNDTIPSISNLKKLTYWNYNSLSKHHGESILNLSDSLF
jgi:hypothetical protein